MTVGQLKEKLKEVEDFVEVHVQGCGEVQEVTDIYEGGVKKVDQVVICLWGKGDC